MKNPGIPFGLKFGIVSIVMSILLYMMNPAYYLNYRVVIIFVLSFYFLYLAAKTARDSMGGYISLGQSFLASFSTWIIATLLTTIFAYVFINFIDPTLPDLMLQIAEEAIEKTEEVFGGEMAERLQEELEDNGVDMGIGNMLSSWLMGLLVGAFISFVIGLIVKKEEDVFS